MAKRKAVRVASRKTAAKAAAKRRPKAASRRLAARKPASKSTARKSKSARAVTPKARTRSAAKKRAAAKRPTRQAGPKTAAAKRAVRARTAPASRRASGGTAKGAAPPPRTPALSRKRRTIADDDFMLTPPSSLDLDRRASSVRSGRRELHERYDLHTETGPELTGGDIDADWESASTVGDEAPGGDNPTPDQDIVDEIGHALGVEYQDNEELKGEKKISDRDRHRWELDPASSDDYEDR